MKRIGILLLAIFLLLTLAACSLADLGIHKVTTEPTPTRPPVTTSPNQEDPLPTEPPTMPPNEKVMGTVSASVLNVRQTPGDGKVVSSLEKEARVQILEMQFLGNSLWGRVEDGWVSMGYIILDNPDYLPYSSLDLLSGVTLESNVRVYKGPGTQYASGTKLSKHTRVKLQGLCGKWGRVEQGWIHLDKVYLDGQKGPQESFEVKVTKLGTKLHADPDETSTVNTGCREGQWLTILFFGEIEGVEWGCTDQGWVLMENVQMEIDPAIFGTWYNWKSNGTSGYYITTYTFQENGTWQTHEYYYYSMDGSYKDTTDMDSVVAGTYTFDGRTLDLEKKPMSAYVRDDELTMGSSGQTYTKGGLKEAIDEISDTPMENNSAIRGSWYRSLGQGANGIYYAAEYQFQKDRYSYTVLEYHSKGDKAGQLVRPAAQETGTYKFDGSALALEGELELWSAQASGSTLVMDSKTYYRLEGDSAIIAKLFGDVQVEYPTEPPTEAPTQAPEDTGSEGGAEEGIDPQTLGELPEDPATQEGNLPTDPVE